MKDFSENTEAALDISEIISRKLAGEDLSDEDEKKLNDWIFSSERNRSLYDRIRDSRNFDQRNELMRQINTEGAWFGYKQKIGINPDRKRHIQWWQYAAAMLIPALIISDYLTFLF